MNRSIYLLFNWIVLSSLLTGCWSQRELNELSIATALGIDKTDDGFLVTVQIVNPTEIAGKALTNRTEIVIFSTTGKSVFEALGKMTLKSPRKIYLSHITTIVFGEELAKAGIEKTLDFLSRNHEMRTNFYISVARNTTANKILQIQTPLEKVPGIKIYSTLESAEKNWATIKTLELDELINDLTSEGKQPVLPGIKFKGDNREGAKNTNVETSNPKSKIEADTFAVFTNDRLQGWLTQNESKGFNYITDQVKNTVEVLDYKGCIVTIETLESKTKVSGMIRNGKPIIQIEVRSKGNIGELQCDIDTTKNETIKEIEKKYSEKHKKQMKAALESAQSDFKSDIFGFGEIIYRSNPAEWKKLKRNWDEHFANLDVQINVESEIQDTGTISKSFIE